MSKDLNILLIANVEESAKLKNDIKGIRDIHARFKSCGLEEGWGLVVDGQPNVVIMVVEDDYETYLSLVKKTKEYYHGINVIILSDNTEADYILSMFNCGIKTYLKMPYEIDKLQQAIVGTYQEVSDTDKHRVNSKVISVFSNKGGIGVTSVATNLAVSLSELPDTRVLLCDFVFHHGDIAIFLDSEIKYTINELITNINRIDKVFLENSLSKTASGLSILHSPENPEDSEYINTKHLVELIQVLKKYYDFIIIDTSHDYNDNNITIFDASDIVLQLLTLELPCICNCGKTLEVFQKLRYERDKVKLVVNRTNAKNQIASKLVEEQLNYKIYYALPNDYLTVVKAINNGRSIFDISRNAAISNAIKGLRDSLLKEMNREYPQDKKSVFEFFKKKK